MYLLNYFARGTRMTKSSEIIQQTRWFRIEFVTEDQFGQFTRKLAKI